MWRTMPVLSLCPEIRPSVANVAAAVACAISTTVYTRSLAVIPEGCLLGARVPGRRHAFGCLLACKEGWRTLQACCEVSDQAKHSTCAVARRLLATVSLSARLAAHHAASRGKAPANEWFKSRSCFRHDLLESSRSTASWFKPLQTLHQDTSQNITLQISDVHSSVTETPIYPVAAGPPTPPA